MNQINNETEFKKLVDSSQDYNVLDFYADWCGPCQMVLPIFEQVSQEPSLSSFIFAKINRDENMDWIEKYGFDFRTIPRFFVVKFQVDGNFDKKNILMELGGSQSKSEMVSKIQQIQGENQLETNLEPGNQSPKSVINQKPKVAIIGSGPSGLTAAIYTARAQLDTTVFAGNQPGGQLTTTTEIENFPGAWDPETKKGMMGPKLMDTIRQQAEHFGAKTQNVSVEAISAKTEGGHTELVARLNDGQTEQFDAVIIASGASPRYLDLPGEMRFVGKGYHTCATCDGFFYRKKTIAVVGGGDSAMEEAQFPTRFADKVYLIHRRDEFRASKIMLERAKNNPKIEFLTPKKITALHGEEFLTSISLEDLEDGSVSELALDGVFVAIGHIPNTDFVPNILDKDNAGYLIPQKSVHPEARMSKYDMATRIPGVFVAGDVEDTVYRQAVTAAGNGCRAAIDCEKWLEEQHT